MATKQTASAGALSVPDSSISNIADKPAELDSAVLAYLVSRGLTKTVKAFEKDVAGVKPGKSGALEKAWSSVTAG
jgi:hypothetical protein